MTRPRHLVIFARQPRAGAGKRRLAAEIGPVEAVRFQRVRLAMLIARHGRDPRWTTWLAVTPDGSQPWPAHLGRVPQGRGDLGQRMGRVFARLPPGPAVMIGTDIPRITGNALMRAFHALGANDAVFGPAGDGGYWLVGLRRAPRARAPFEGVRWSTADALADTLANLADAAVACVDTLDDIDDARAFKGEATWNRLCAGPIARRASDDGIGAEHHRPK